MAMVQNLKACLLHSFLEGGLLFEQQFQRNGEVWRQLR
jgi:hypothetical protein